MSSRALVIGLDGADLSVVERLGPRALPTLYALMEHGAFARLQSVIPAATLPNWLTFLTGVDPSVHGVFDFTTRRGYSVDFRGGSAREVPTLMSRLDAIGLSCACLGFPGTYPPERLMHGVFVSGWDSPVAFRADRSFVWPRTLYDRMAAADALVFDDVDEFHADDVAWIEQLPRKLEARMERRAHFAASMLAERSWDLFACYFGETDTASHYLWPWHDAESPRRVPNGIVQPDGLAEVYRAADRSVAALVNEAGPRCEVTVLSDHGSGGSSAKVLYLNRALLEAGLLRFRTEGPSPWSAVRAAALRAMPSLLRERAFRWSGAALPSWLESRNRFASIDWAGTQAFSEELNYFPSVHLNVAGREPRGVVRPADVPAVREQVRRALHDLRDPWTREPVVARVWDREELFRGPWRDRAPDLILELHLDREHSYNVMPSSAAPSGTGPWRLLDGHELLGRKGRSLPGSHRCRGLLIVAGPRIAKTGEVQAAIADVAPTLLARLDVAIPPEFRGRILASVLDPRTTDRTLPSVPKGVGAARTSERQVARRLRALGYLD